MQYQLGETVEVCFKGVITEVRRGYKDIKYKVEIEDEFVYASITPEYVYPLEKEEK